METTHYELEEKMGNGNWYPVYETKIEADYEEPDRLTFQTKDEARQYGNTDTQRWGKNALTRGYVRIVAVRTTRSEVE